jgi:hypothetical protein
MATEVNNLIQEIRPVIDDGCDHTALIIDSWHCAARARSRAPATKPPQPILTSEQVKSTGAVVKIGNRTAYGKTIITGIYQLYLLGKTGQEIAKALKMSEDKVDHFLALKTERCRTIYFRCKAQPLPHESEIMRALAKESRA